MELGSDRAEREKQVLAQIAEEFPDTEVVRVWGAGFEAFPKGTPVIRATDVGGVLAKLRRHRDGSQ